MLISELKPNSRIHVEGKWRTLEEYLKYRNLTKEEWISERKSLYQEFAKKQKETPKMKNGLIIPRILLLLCSKRVILND